MVAALFTGMVMQAQPNVKVKGYVNAPEELRTPVNISVVNAVGDTVWQKTKRHPRMRFKVPADQEYVVIFEQEGSMTKTVEIDARHAVRPYTERQTRPIRFEVIMERATKKDIRYAGAVGKIDFSAMNGRMDVAYDYTIEDLAERKKVEPQAYERQNFN